MLLGKGRNRRAVPFLPSIVAIICPYKFFPYVHLNPAHDLKFDHLLTLHTLATFTHDFNNYDFHRQPAVRCHQRHPSSVKLH